MLQGWLHKFFETVQTLKPQLIALHMQEVGGKDYELCMGNVNIFIQKLIESDTLKGFDRVCVLLDKDFTIVDQFTVSIIWWMLFILIFSFVICFPPSVIARQTFNNVATFSMI